MKIRRRIKLCGCGCGEIVKNRFALGHHIRVNPLTSSPEARKKASERMKKNNPMNNPETRKKLSESLKGKIPWNKGKPWGDETKKKNSDSRKKQWQDPEYRTKTIKSQNEERRSPKGRKRLSDITKKIFQDPEARKKISASMKKNWQDPECRAKMIKALQERLYTSITKRKQSKTMKAKFKDPKFCERFFRNRGVLPNKLELKVQDLLNNLFPNEYKYVGNFDTFIGGKCPDFINVNGQKKLIEVFGDYYHEDKDSQKRIDHFAKYGFKTSVIWESDIEENIGLVSKELISFHSKNERKRIPLWKQK